MSEPTLCLMLKAPRLGDVKTRLARDIGAPAALAAYRWLVERQVRAVPENWSVEVHYTPAGSAEEMRSWLQPLRTSPIHFAPQADGDLGDRLAAAYSDVWERGVRRILFAGGDCPTLDDAALREAAERLASAEVVVIPARDGGYVLIGFRGRYPAVFENIAWSTGSVLRETLECLEALGLSHTLMEAMEDVDDVDSWERAKQLSGFQ